MSKTVYAFDAHTRVYLGPLELDDGDLSPLDSTEDAPVYLIPGNCLEVEPPVPADGMRAIAVDGEWVVEPIPVDPVDPPAPAPTLEGLQGLLRDAATAKRWEVETGGLTLPNGARVLTRIEDQNRISNAVTNALRLGLASVSFKSADGEFFTTPIADLVAIADAVGLHVQACFDAERGHYEAIAALGSVPEAQAYDVAAGWPGQD
jgi:hypothetical protein